MLDGLLRLDGQILLAVQGLRQPWLNEIMSFYTQLGNAGILWIVLSLVMLLNRRTRKAGMLALCAMALGLLAVNVTIKPLVERARPWLVLPVFPLVVERDPNSFPSGHTCAAFAACVSWALALPLGRAGRTAVVALAVCMGLSRLYVGVHFPSDVLVGAVIGTLCALAVWKMFQAAQKGASRGRKGSG